MFTYCLNNPINLVDRSGCKPGDLFDTEEEAVRNAADYIGGLSFINGWEYSTAIYKVTETYYVEQTITTHERLDGRAWVMLVETEVVAVTITKYTYDQILTDNHAFSVRIPRTPGYERVSVLHTHPRGSNRGITQFSTTDRQNALQIYGCPIYVYGPNGRLLKFDPLSYTEATIYDNLAISVKRPWKDCPSWLMW